MPFNQELPEWNAVGTKPPQSKLDAGWQIGERPPSGWWNWSLNRTYLAIQELQNEAINVDQKGVANGIATLDASGKVPASQLNVSAPADATTSTKGVVQLSNSTTSTSEVLAATPKAVKTVDDKIGTLSGLNTTAKDNLVNAVNELFTDVGNGKTQIATAITGKGVAASGGDTFSQLATKIGQIETGGKRASGTKTSGTSFLSCTLTDNSTRNFNSLFVDGLDFTPKYILIYNSAQGFIDGSFLIGGSTAGREISVEYARNSTSRNFYVVKSSGSQRPITFNGGFEMPVNTGAVNYTWFAFE